MRAPSGRAALLPAIGLVAIALLTYARAALGQWIWDDNANVTHCEPVLAWDGLAHIWLDPTAIQQYYPLVHTSFWIEHKLWGLQPFGFHAVNVLLHALNAWLVWRVLQRLGLPVAAAWVGAALFAVHPVHAESVAWVTERKNTLSFAFYAASALCWLRWAGFEKDAPGTGRPRTWAVALLLFVLALLAKSATVALPVALLIAAWWKWGRLDRRVALSTIPFFAAAVAIGLLTIHLERENVGTVTLAERLAPLERPLVAGRALWFYAAKLLAPVDLNFIYPRWTLDPRSAAAWAWPGAAVAALGALWGLRRRIGRGPFAATLAWSAILAPVLGAFDLFFFRYSFVSDHFQYHASPAAFALIGAGLARTGMALGGPRSIAPRIGLAALLVALGATTIVRIGVFHDVPSLWADTLRRNPRAWMAWNNLGQEALEAGHPEEAETMFRRAIAIDSTQREPWNNLGVSWMNAGRPVEAMAAFERAVALHPGDVTAQENLGRALLLAGRLPEAIVQLRRATANPEHSAEPVLDLIGALARSGAAAEAEGIARSARSRYPRDSRFDLLLANLLVRRGAAAEAVAPMERAVSLSGRRDPMLLDRLAYTLAAARRFDEAARALEEAIALHPGPDAEAALRRRLDAVRHGVPPP